MKKALLSLAIIASAVSAQASYLFWQCSGEEDWYTGGLTLAEGLEGYTITSIYIKDTGGNSYATYETTSATPVVASNFFKSSNVYANISTFQDQGYSYFVEIQGYAQGGSVQDTGVIAMSNAYTVDALQGNYSLLDDLSAMAQAAATPMMGSSYAAPEPTSGLLLLVGGALLALKRRRV